MSPPDNIRFTCQALRQDPKKNVLENPCLSSKTSYYKNIHVVAVWGILQACDGMGLFIHSNLPQC